MERKSEIRPATSNSLADSESDPVGLNTRDLASQISKASGDGTMVGSRMEAASEQVAVAPKLGATPPVYQRGSIAEWTVTALLLLFASTSLAWSYVIPTGSMEDTLMIGDHMVVDKLAYSPASPLGRLLLPYEKPARGDIIAFRYPADISQMFVKRVIGLPGERLKIVNQQVYINEKPINEPYVYHKSGYFDPYRDNFPNAAYELEVAPDRVREARLNEMLDHHVSNGAVVIPADSYFVMGDNRDNSLDSRYWGFVPRDNVVGKPVFVYWSYDTSTDMLMPRSATGYTDHLVDVCTHFFTKTRWNRTFKLIRGYQFPEQIQ
jgi:signal peptidase I